MKSATQTAIPASPWQVFVWRKIPSPTWLSGSRARVAAGVSVIVWSRRVKIEVDLLMASDVILRMSTTVLDGVSWVVMQVLFAFFHELIVLKQIQTESISVVQFYAQSDLNSNNFSWSKSRQCKISAHEWTSQIKLRKFFISLFFSCCNWAISQPFPLNKQNAQQAMSITTTKTFHCSRSLLPSQERPFHMA